MRSLFLAISLLVSILCKSQDGNWREYQDSTGKAVMLITPKNDTIIYDTMALIRSLLRAKVNCDAAIEAYHQQLYKAKRLLESINSIMFWKPTEGEKFVL